MPGAVGDLQRSCGQRRAGAVRTGASAIAEDIGSRFNGLVVKAAAGGVVLGTCDTYSEEEFTLHDIRQHVEFRLDYLSNRVFPDGVELG